MTVPSAASTSVGDAMAIAPDAGTGTSAANAADPRLPVNILTGFLGSGKTSLLARLLQDAAFANCAVLINELGDVSLDHQLVEVVDHETIVLAGGCVCCGVRTDLVGALTELNQKRDRGRIPAFGRLVLETTGLADPVPVVHTILSDPKLHFHFRVGTVVATVDAVNGLETLGMHPESVKQAVVADRLVVTKADIAQPGQVAALCEALRRINPMARIVVSRNDAAEEQILAHKDPAQSAGAWVERMAQLGQNLPQGARGLFSGQSRPLGPTHGTLNALHGTTVRTVSLVYDEPLDWAGFGVWFSMLVHHYGSRIWRIKGVLNIVGSPLPTVVHGVQHLIHPPVHLSHWPGGDHRSRIVLIGDLPERDELQHSLDRFMQR